MRDARTSLENKIKNAKRQLSECDDLLEAATTPGSIANRLRNWEEAQNCLAELEREMKRLQ